VSPATHSRETQLYVVHVWRQRARFRASVRRVDCEETRLFTTPTQLARYLAEACSTLVGDGVDAGATCPPPTPVLP
jgi:hypothetical protein